MTSSLKRVFISADIEGVAGVTHLPTTGPGRFEYDLGRRWMTGEVNAAIEGARAAGAGEIVVADGHGTAHNLLLDLLPDNVRIVRSWPRPLLQMQGIEDGKFDAAILVGHHAHARSSHGVLSHTFTLAFSEIRLNDVPQSETTLNILLAAHFGVPTIFASGDDDYISHCLHFLPTLETVITKKCVSFTSSSNLSPKESCRLITQGVEKAMRALDSTKCIEQPKRFVVDCDFRERSQPEMLEYLPWVKRTGPFTIRVEMPDAESAMKYLAFLSFYLASGLPRYGENVS